MSIGQQTSVADRPHRVQLQNPGPAVADGDGFYSNTWSDLSPAEMSVKIEPATAKDLERVTAGTVLSTTTHIITGPYHPQVTTKTRITKGPRNADGTLPAGSREFSVTGVSNPEERNVETIAVCVEVVT